METLHIIILSLIQGITEFLPISSSGHLILPKALFAWPEQGLAFDVAVHLGTLMAVLVYFRKDVLVIAGDWLRSLYTDQTTDNSRLAWYIALATVPAAVAGLLLDSVIETHLRTTLVIALTTIIFGLLLGWADSIKRETTVELAAITINMALIIGCAQALALIPGTSRSGITITAALFCGLSRDASARFSFLLAIPVILLGGAYKTWQLLALPAVNWGDLLLGVVLSAISAFLCIHYFLKFINRIGMMPFVIYRLLLGGCLLLWSFI
ncbi:MAG: undecaprenyl-diphosphate phosphatase [Cellvibrionaceae bacterium]|nr:undecaprenyl-diphosphate phosphatase [Cellvibrionaceae bacterium]